MLSSPQSFHPARSAPVRAVFPSDPAAEFSRPARVGPASPFPAWARWCLAIGSALLASWNAGPVAVQAQDMPGSQVAGESCSQGRISEIFIDNHSIFDPASIPDSGYLGWAYRATNRVHVRTRDSFIADQLLFEEGDCYSPLLVRETTRLLRNFRFIADVDIYSIRQPDDTQHVIVDTRDEWSTKVSLGIRFDEGLRFDGASIVEENFLGRGAAIGFFRQQRQERRAVGGLIEVPRLLGSGWDLGLHGSRTRAGSSFEQRIEYPFLGELGTHAFRQRVSSEHDLYNWVVTSEDEFTHLVLPLESGKAELTGARRFGVPGHLLMLGMGISYEWVHTGNLDEARGVMEADFGSQVDLDSTLALPIRSQLTDRETTRANLIAGIRRIDFQEREGLDALRGVQDVPTGREMVLTLGRSLHGTGDLFGRLDLFGGFAAEHTVGQLYVALEGRHLSGDAGGARDVMAEAHAFLYRPLADPFPQTIVVRGAFQGGWDMRAPFQLTLGGADAVRGLREDAWPGGRRVVLSVEDRVLLPGPFPNLVDLGLTFFGDVGRMYDAGAPFGTDSGWHGSLGAGLRVGFPAGSSAVIRADLAMPLGRDAPREPVLRIHAREWVGILGEFRSVGMNQARRSGVLAEFLGVGRDVRRR